MRGNFKKRLKTRKESVEKKYDLFIDIILSNSSMISDKPFSISIEIFSISSILEKRYEKLKKISKDLSFILFFSNSSIFFIKLMREL